MALVGVGELKHSIDICDLASGSALSPCGLRAHDLASHAVCPLVLHSRSVGSDSSQYFEPISRLCLHALLLFSYAVS
jgi:hypothetical protein